MLKCAKILCNIMRILKSFFYYFREVKTSFTSLSAKLGAIVRELHAGLLQAISREDHNIVLVQLLKVYNVEIFFISFIFIIINI